MKKIILYILITISVVYSGETFTLINTKELKEKMKKGVAIIDIRRVEEYKGYGIIKGSNKITFFDTFRKYNVKKWMKKFTKVITSKNEEFVLISERGNSSKIVAKFLTKKMSYKKVFILRKGILGDWLAEGEKTVGFK
jgi:rhodanese-related sulfurtransferase